LACPDAVAAACAADLARLALHRDPSRPQLKLNFAPDIYSSQQVAAFGALLAARYPGVKLSAAGAGGSNRDCIDAGGSSNHSSSRPTASATSGDDASLGLADRSNDSSSADMEQQQRQAFERAHSEAVVAAVALLLASGAVLSGAQQHASSKLQRAAKPATAAAITAGDRYMLGKSVVHSRAASLHAQCGQGCTV
jgi:hypothetical protein